MKKWISIALAALMTFSSCASIVQARETDDLPHEGTYFYYDRTSGTEDAAIIDSSYKSAYALLNYLGILNDETLSADDAASRGLAAQIFGVMKARTINSATSAPFSDVPVSHKYANGIYTAKQVGVVNADEKGKFRPNADIMISEAVEMALFALGYNDAPEEYLKTTTVDKLKRDLLNGISGQDNTLTTGELMFLALNTLESPMFSPDSFTIDNGVLNPTGNLNKNANTLLSDYDIDFISGVVTAVGGFSMFVSKSVDQNTVQINRKNYITESPLSITSFGKSVCAYVAEDLIIASWEDIQYNNVISAKADEFNFISDTVAEYFDENGRKKSKRIASNALAVYNMESGVALSQAFAEGLVSKADAISLIDNNGDENIDVVLLYDYDYRVVDETSSSGLIYFKYDKEKVDFEDVLSMQLNGKEVNITDISAGDIAMFMSTSRYGEQKHQIILSRNTVVGVLESISNKGASLIFNIDGEEYEMTDFYKNYFMGTDIAPEEVRPAIGDEVTFYLAADGCIVSSSVSSNNGWNFAYLMSANRRENGFENSTYIKLFDVAKLSVSTYVVDDKIELYTWPLENSTYTVEGNATPEKVEQALLDENGYKTEMIAYKLDDEGKLTSLATEYIGETGTRFFVSSYPLVRNHVTGTGLTGSSNWLYMGGLGTLYNIKSAAAIKVPPLGASNSERTEEAFYNKWKYTTDVRFANDYTTGDSMTIYNSDAACNAGLVVYRPEPDSATAGGTIVDGYAPTILISKKLTVLDDDGDVVTRVYYPGTSRMESIDFASEVEFSALKTSESTDYYGKPLSPDDIGAGDIIQYELDNYGDIKYVRVLFKNDNRGTYRCQYGTGDVLTSTRKEFDAMIVMSWGKVTDKKGTTLVQNLSSMGNDAPEYDYPLFFNGMRNSEHSGGTQYYLWDSTSKEASVITFDEIKKGDEVVVISDYNVSYRAFVYR